MKKYLVGTADTNEKQMCNVGDFLVITANGDTPKYVNPSSGLAGNLGIPIHKDYWECPTFNSEVAGTLDETKYYSILLRPISTYLSDKNSGKFMMGSLTHYSEPIKPTVASKGLVFDIPDFGDDKVSFDSGYETNSTATTITDSTKTWAVDQWKDFEAYNPETKQYSTISGNTADTLTFASDIGVGGDDPYWIVQPLITNFEVYGMEMNAQVDVIANQAFTLQGFVDVGSQFTLGNFISGGVTALDGNFPPDPYYACINGGDKVIFGGGQSLEGSGYVDLTASSSSASATNPVAITVESTYSFDSISGKTGSVIRYTFSDSSQYQTGIRRGSYVDITGAEDSENDFEGIVTRVASDGSWFEISNDGKVNADDETIAFAFKKNLLVANGLVDSMLRTTIFLEGDPSPIRPIWIDLENGVAGLSELYMGANTSTGVNFTSSSDFGLGWSDFKNPFIVRTENTTPMGDRINSFAVFNQNLIIFCGHSVYGIPLTGLGQAPYLISNDVECRSPHSVVTTPTGVLFYDGTGISKTDGIGIISVTAYKANKYLRGINQNKVKNMRGAYNQEKRQAHYVFAYADEDLNNYGLTIAIDNNNCYPTQRLDCNAIWFDRDEFGDLKMYHGTSDGVIWEHDDELGTDGVYSTVYSGNITLVDNVANQITVDFGQEVTDTVHDGNPVLFFPSQESKYLQFKSNSFTHTATDWLYTFDVENPDDFDVGGLITLGAIPFDYGVKWKDFSSPQYPHKIREVQMDVTESSGVMFLTHYKDLIDVPLDGSTEYLNIDKTKLVFKNRMGEAKQYGYRFCGISVSPMEIHSMEILYDPHV